jgi:hypothetical protein
VESGGDTSYLLVDPGGTLLGHVSVAYCVVGLDGEVLGIVGVIVVEDTMVGVGVDTVTVVVDLVLLLV